MRTELCFRPPEAFAQAIEISPIKFRRHGSHIHQLVVMQSRKNACNLRLEPLLLDFCLMLERRPDVICYKPTPYNLAHPVRNIHYTPSICAYGHGIGLVFFDITRLSFPAHEAQCARLAEWFDEMGYLFYPHTVGLNSYGGEQCQWRYLYHNTFGSQPSKVAATLETLQSHGPMSIQELLNTGAEFCDIAEVLFNGSALADMRFPLQRTTRVQLAGHHHER